MALKKVAMEGLENGLLRGGVYVWINEKRTFHG